MVDIAHIGDGLAMTFKSHRAAASHITNAKPTISIAKSQKSEDSISVSRRWESMERITPSLCRPSLDTLEGLQIRLKLSSQLADKRMKYFLTSLSFNNARKQQNSFVFIFSFLYTMLLS